MTLREQTNELLKRRVKETAARSELKPRADWSTDEHRSKLFDVCHEPEEAYKRIQALEHIAAVLSARVDELEKENAELKREVVPA